MQDLDLVPQKEESARSKVSTAQSKKKKNLMTYNPWRVKSSIPKLTQNTS